VTEHEVHQCILELTAEQQRHRGFAQRLTFHGTQLARLQELNGLGTLFDGDDRIATFDYVYERGRIVEWQSSSRNGVVRGSGKLSADETLVSWLDERGRPRVYKETQVSGIRRTLNAAGRVTSYTFIDAKGVPALSEDERYEVRVQRNPGGAIMEQSYFDAQGKPMRDKHGLHREVYTIDRGLTVGTLYFDERMAPLANSHGVHQLTVHYDDVGNWLEEAYFGLDGKPVLSSETAAARCKVTRDEHGDEISRSYFDTQGSPTRSSFGYITRYTKRDAAGDAIEWGALDGFGAPDTFGPHKHSILRVVRDLRGNNTLEMYFDGDGAPMTTLSGYHAVKQIFDERDNMVLGTYLDEHQRVTEIWNHVASWKNEYDGDRLVATWYLDANGDPIDAKWGFSLKRREYDDRGVPGAWQYFNADDRPVNRIDGLIDAKLMSNLEW
jgi:hypothetical protein